MAAHDPRRVYDGRYMGLAIHQFLAVLLATGNSFALDLLMRLAAEHAASQGPTTYARAAVQRLVTAASVYGEFFRPEAEWSLAGVEAAVGRLRLDLLWQHADERFADEIKTGPSSLLLSEQAITKQAAAQLRAATRKYGDAFL